MTHHATNGYLLLPRPLLFDRRALIYARAFRRLPLDVERQLSAIERRQRLRAEIRAPSARYAPSIARRRPPC